MSENVHYHGIIKKVSLKMDQTLEQKCYQILIDNNIKIDKKYYDSYLDQVTDYLSDKYLYNKKTNTLYEYLSLEYSDPDNCHCSLKFIDDDIFEFDSIFYNGSTCLDEMINDELNKL